MPSTEDSIRLDAPSAAPVRRESGRAAAEAAVYRYERKFFVSDLSRYEVDSLVRLHPALFSEVYPPRNVNNLYLDSFDAKSYLDNVEGVRDRLKVRIRWYGELFGRIEKPVLELKIKRGLMGRKESYRLPPFCLAPGSDRDEIARLIELADLSEDRRLELTALHPALLNRYRRKYFLSADRRVRLTLDTTLEFFRAMPRNNTFLRSYREASSTVLELKYGPGDDERATEIAPHFPFRMTRSSKYVMGLDFLDL